MRRKIKLVYLAFVFLAGCSLSAAAETQNSSEVSALGVRSEFRTANQINSDIENIERVALEVYQEHKGLLDHKKGYDYFNKKHKERLDPRAYAEIVSSEIEPRLVVRMAKAIIDGFFSSHVVEVLEAREFISSELWNFYQKRYSSEAMTALATVPFIISRKPKHKLGLGEQEIGGAFASFDGVLDLASEIETEVLKTELELNGEKVKTRVFWNGKKAATFIRSLLIRIFGSAQTVTVAERYSKPLEGRLEELYKKWAIAEETAHALDHFEFPHLRKANFRGDEAHFLNRHVWKNRDKWFEDDVQAVLEHPQLDQYINWLKKDEEAEEVGDWSKEIRGILEEDYSREYSRFWDYLHSEGELRAKWQSTQYLKIVWNAELTEIIKAHLYDQMKSHQMDDEDYSIFYRELYFIAMPKTLRNYYKRLYESDEVPLELNAFALAIILTRRTSLQIFIMLSRQPGLIPIRKTI